MKPVQTATEVEQLAHSLNKEYAKHLTPREEPFNFLSGARDDAEIGIRLLNHQRNLSKVVGWLMDTTCPKISGDNMELFPQKEKRMEITALQQTAADLLHINDLLLLDLYGREDVHADDTPQAVDRMLNARFEFFCGEDLKMSCEVVIDNVRIVHEMSAVLNEWNYCNMKTQTKNTQKVRRLWFELVENLGTAAREDNGYE